MDAHKTVRLERLTLHLLEAVAVAEKKRNQERP